MKQFSMFATLAVASGGKDKILYVTNRKEWRAWLEKRVKSQKEVWLVYYKKHTGQPRIPYNKAVEEALRFGWITRAIQEH